jgi:phage terminase large subunit GpA-like protein
VDIDWRGKVRRKGLILWQVGTNLAKDLIFGRLQIERQGPGFMHFSKDLSDEFYKQLAGEARVERAVSGGRESRWTPLRKRVEALDCTVYAVWLETHLELAKKPAYYWEQLADIVQPAIGDLFVAPMVISDRKPPKLPAPKLEQQTNQAAPASAPVPQSKRGGSTRFASEEWSNRGFN